MNKWFWLFLLFAISFSACRPAKKDRLDLSAQISYCAAQASKTLASMPADTLVLPRTIEKGKTEWRYIPIRDWTSGFWPGTLWYLYEATGQESWKAKADSYSRLLTPLSQRPAADHDLGFMVFCSFGNGYRLTGNPEYKKIILATADTLATLFNPKVGTILSWPWMVRSRKTPHNTIIDNMMNLELLFWASKNGGADSLYDIAVRHAETTMANHFRPDYSSYHVLFYNDTTGAKIKGITHQGFADESMWARGQAWGIYGFTMTYRETRDSRFLEVAQKAADRYLQNLPEDFVPYWDFNAPNIPNEPRDASAAAITASALLELSTLVPNPDKSAFYRTMAENMLKSLSTETYQSRDLNPAFLQHSTGHKPGNSEIDVSINYADYYYLEALLRLQKLRGQTAP